MNEKNIIKLLSENLAIYSQFLSTIAKEQAIWKPSENSWSLLEVVCHLLDEEKLDFKARIIHLFKHPNVPPPPIDPKGWVIEKKYAQQDFQQILELFLLERRSSIAWLEELENPPWENSFLHNHFGEMSASLFLTNWLAHDYFHFRQITKLNFLYLGVSSKHSLNYAGGI